MAWSFGQLLSWGNLTGTAGTDLIYFSGPSSLAGTVRTSWPVEWKPKYVSPLVNIGSKYWFDTAGYSAMPLDGPPELSYTVQLVAPSSDSDDVAFHYLRTQWEVIWDFVGGTYTLDSVPGVSGQRGWLVVQDERLGNTTLYKTKARCAVPGEFTLVKGQPSTLEVTMTYWPLGEFTAYAP
jgi:hypothetical protein